MDSLDTIFISFSVHWIYFLKLSMNLDQPNWKSLQETQDNILFYEDNQIYGSFKCSCGTIIIKKCPGFGLLVVWHKLHCLFIIWTQYYLVTIWQMFADIYCWHLLSVDCCPGCIFHCRLHYAFVQGSQGLRQNKQPVYCFHVSI